MQLAQVQLKNLNPGQEAPSGPVNARRSDANGVGMGSIKSLAEHIKAVGIIVPLIVVRDERTPANTEDLYVVDGGRRLAAMRFLAKSKAPGWTADTKVPVMLRGQLPISALETSMATAAFALPHHPVDRFEAYSAMVANGVSVDDIAARYSVEKTAVRQALRLAGLAPELRAAWRAGTITADVAEAFLAEPDAAKQVEVFNALKKSRNLYRHAVSHALKSDPQTLARVIKFVGRTAYEKAGGAILGNLFSEGETVSDSALLNGLAREKMVQRAAELLKEGWGWVDTSVSAPSGLFQLERTWPKAGKYSKEQRAAAGVFLFIGHDGKIQEERGLLKAGAKDPAKAGAKASSGKDTAKPKAKKKKPGEVSAALERRLREYKILLAVNVMDAYGLDLAKTDPASSVAWKVLVSVIGPQPFYGLDNSIETAIPAILDALPAKAVNTYIAEGFRADDYFASISRDQRAAAVTEAMGKDHAAKLAKMKTGDQIEFCVENVFKTAGWLPTQIRTAHYKGPGAETTKPAAKVRGRRK